VLWRLSVCVGVGVYVLRERERANLYKSECVKETEGEIASTWM